MYKNVQNHAIWGVAYIFPVSSDVNNWKLVFNLEEKKNIQCLEDRALVLFIKNCQMENMTFCLQSRSSSTVHTWQWFLFVITVKPEVLMELLQIGVASF